MNSAKKSVSTTYNFAKVAMGADGIQNLRRDEFMSLNDPNLAYATQLVRQLVKDIADREGRYYYQIERNGEQKTYKPNFPLPVFYTPELTEHLKIAADVQHKIDDIYAQASKKGEKPVVPDELLEEQRQADGPILAYLTDDVMQVFNANSSLVKNLAVLMAKKVGQYERDRESNPDAPLPQVSSTDLQILIQQNKVFEKKPSLIALMRSVWSPARSGFSD